MLRVYGELLLPIGIAISMAEDNLPISDNGYGSIRDVELLHLYFHFLIHKRFYIGIIRFASLICRLIFQLIASLNRRVGKQGAEQ
ncbi:hypothetical protein D3C77_485680 [compost metagenome]